jgi:hypothetical protein
MIYARGIECLLDISGPGKIEPAAAASARILGHGNHAVKDATGSPAISRLWVCVDFDGVAGRMRVSNVSLDSVN